MHFKQISLTIIFILFCRLLEAQYNHVRNSDFEQTYGDVDCGACDVTLYSRQITYWNQLWPWTMPEKIGMLAPGSPDHICSSGPVGPQWGYALTGEYIVQELGKPVEQGKLYYLSYYYYGNPQKNVGIRFYKNRPKQKNSNHRIENDGDAHIDGTQYINSGIFTTPVYGEWKKAYKYWIADDNYDYIALGAFGKDNNGFLSIDGIRIIEVGSSSCPEWNLLQNDTYTDNIELEYRSTHITGAGNAVDADKNFGNLTIAAQSTITLKSSNKVVMEDGFHVNEGGTLHAIIAPCEAKCIPPNANAGEDFIICREGKYILGTPGNYSPENNYTWTAEPDTAIKYLSCSDCPNPTINLGIFDRFGGIKYTLTVTNQCGETATDDVYIIYDLISSQFTPSVNAFNIITNEYIEFDVNCDLHTEKIFIEVYKTADNSLVHSETLKRGDDFISIPFHWKINRYLTNCDDYYLKIYSKNFCHPDTLISSIQTILWNRNRTITLSNIPNVMSIPNPPNNNLCYGISGAENYSIYIQHPYSGNTIYQASGSLVGTNGCIWDGTCNGSMANCPNGLIPNGTYPVVVEFWNCKEKISIPHFITIFSSKKEKQETDINEPEITILPNPSDGEFIIDIGFTFETPINIEVYNSFGSIIYTTKITNNSTASINLKEAERGIYFVKISNEQINSIKKIIFQ